MSDKVNKKKGVRFAEPSVDEPPSKRRRDDEIPAADELERLKRERRRHRDHDDDQSATVINSKTSLLHDEDNQPEIEPFDMKQEQEDGTGYFDGDTYVFRKRNADEEPDAWLESLQEEQQAGGGGETRPYRLPSSREDVSDTEAPSIPTPQLYQTVVALLAADDETVLQAIQRYGGLLKQDPSNSRAKESLDAMTTAANQLLMREGVVDIYQQSRRNLRKHVPSKPRRVVQWEYRGNQDEQLHGPFATSQMKGWIQQGYFVGASAVNVRWIQEQAAEASLQDDLLNDLMDDDEDEHKLETQQMYGEWMLSDQVNFDEYA